MLAECDINQYNLCEFAVNGELGKLKIICEYLDENGKNTEYNLDIAGTYPGWPYNNNYPIRWACLYGKIDIVKYLMDKWSHLIDITNDDNYAIRYACRNGHINLVVYLMEKWSNLIDISANNNNAICWACINNNIDIVKYLMENWSHLIDITARDNSAIHYALMNDYINIVKYLIAVSIKKILDHGIQPYDINKIIILLVDNDCIYEYYLLINELKKRKFKFNSCEVIEEQIENKRNLCAQIECHPGLIGGNMGKNCEEGLNEVKLLQ